MKKIIISLLSILNVLIISAQDQCLTASPEPPQWIFNKSAKALLTTRSYSLNIFVHIVRSSSGQGLSTEILSTIVNSLNSNYSDADIQFALLGSEYIDNDYYYVNLNGKENQLFGINSHCEAIDIYVLGSSTTWDGAGLADNIPSTALIVHGNYYGTSTLPHEMGHCLGLYHTHHGTVNEGGSDTDQCAELVDGSNSTTCGDYITDTPADPNQWSSSNCTYIGTGTDANGDHYSPNASNFMSYAYKPCRVLFSELQIDRMKDFIDNTTILQNVFHSTISGPSYVCINTEVSFTVNNAPPNYSWDHSDNLVAVNDNPGTFTTLFLKGDAWVSISICGVEVARKEFVIGSEVTGIGQITYAGRNRYYASPACTGELNNIWILEWQGMDLLVDKPDTVYGKNYVDVLSTTNPNNLTIATLTLKQGSYTYTKFITIMGVDVGLDGIHLPSPFDPVLTLSPNPSTGETTIGVEQDYADETSLKSASVETSFDEDTEWDLEVYNSMQSLKLKKQKIKSNKAIINTQSWKEGVYMVRVKYKDKVLTGKLVVKR